MNPTLIPTCLLKHSLIKSAEIFLNNNRGIRSYGVRKKFISTEDTLRDHFENYTDFNHPCKQTLTKAINQLVDKPANIVETGSSAWGSNSSMLFDSYVNSFGGNFFSVDIRLNPMVNLLGACTNKSHFYRDDSVNFLQNFNHPISLLYLDSFDVDWLDPLPSMIHGLREFLAIYPVLSPGSIILIDDSPKNGQAMEKVCPEYSIHFNNFYSTYGFFPGKGALVLNYLNKFATGKLIAHDYQIVWRL